MRQIATVRVRGGVHCHVIGVCARLLKRYLQWRSRDVMASTANGDLQRKRERLEEARYETTTVS